MINGHFRDLQLFFVATMFHHKVVSKENKCYSMTYNLAQICSNQDFTVVTSKLILAYHCTKVTFSPKSASYLGLD